LADGFDIQEVFFKFNHLTIIAQYQLSVAKAAIANKQQA
jgi:hypothetical protein